MVGRRLDKGCPSSYRNALKKTTAHIRGRFSKSVYYVFEDSTSAYNIYLHGDTIGRQHPRSLLRLCGHNFFVGHRSRAERESSLFSFTDLSIYLSYLSTFHYLGLDSIHNFELSGHQTARAEYYATLKRFTKNWDNIQSAKRYENRASYF
jgi:hypothetical protein